MDVEAKRQVCAPLPCLQRCTERSQLSDFSRMAMAYVRLGSCRVNEKCYNNGSCWVNSFTERVRNHQP